MAIVSVSKAAKLVRRGRASLYRDIENGRLSKTVSPTGETGIETSELIRAYGQLYSTETNETVSETTAPGSINEFSDKVESWNASADVSKRPSETSGDGGRTQILEERIKNLERILEVEKELRRVKDSVTEQLTARVIEKDALIKTLESKVMLLEYTKPAADAPKQGADAASSQQRQGFWSRIIGTKRR